MISGARYKGVPQNVYVLSVIALAVEWYAPVSKDCGSRKARHVNELTEAEINNDRVAVLVQQHVLRFKLLRMRGIQVR